MSECWESGNSANRTRSTEVEDKVVNTGVQDRNIGNENCEERGLGGWEYEKQTNDERLIGFEDNSKVGGERGTAVVE